ncbi:hypothetical protein [Amycolatopsis sp. NPDC004625]|uniref:hypothetical protein n=1 Tax=Amycolatopsis sp. NPDC004625 TaxID=3154670 RepID=UPI0033B0DC03
MTDGYEVTPEILKRTAKGINDIIAELKDLGIAESGEIGRGFSQLELRGMQVGDRALETQFAEFCERWTWGVRSLVQDGNQFASMLHLAAGEYHDAEQYAIGVLKDATGSLAGDPHKTDDQIEQESFGDIAGQANPVNGDYSAASFEKLGSDASQTWRTEGRELSEGPMGLGKDVENAIGAGDQADRARDQVFGKDTRPSGS